MSRFLYALYRLAEALVSAVSRFINAVFFGGSTAQTLSARAYIEGLADPVWERRRVFIDRLFFFQTGHCEWSWETELASARKTVARNDPLDEGFTGALTAGLNQP